MGIVVVIAVVVGIIALVKFGKPRGNGSDSSGRRGLDILEERFARGEIDAEAFRSMKSELEAKA